MSCTPEETIDTVMSGTTATGEAISYPAVVTLQPRNPAGEFVDMEVPGELIGKASGLVRDVIQDDGDNDSIPLPMVTVDQLEFILAFYTRYLAEPFNIPTNKDVEDVDKWFILKEGSLVDNGFPAWAEDMLNSIPLTDEPIQNNGRYKNLFLMKDACNYMECSELMHFIYIKISSLITGKTPEQTREIFAKVNDFDDVDEFHYEDKVHVITDKTTGKTREVVQKIKVWDKLTQETAKLINSIPA